MRKKHAFDMVSIIQFKHVLGGSIVFRDDRILEFESCDREVLDKVVSEFEREIGHLLESLGSPLVDPLADLGSPVRRLAAIGPASKPAVPKLSEALNDFEWQVRKPAAEALAAIGPASKPTVPTLVELLHDEEWHVRKAAAQALGAIGPDAAKAIPTLKEALDDFEEQVCDAAAEALKKIAGQVNQ